MIIKSDSLEQPAARLGGNPRVRACPRWKSGAEKAGGDMECGNGDLIR